MESKFKKARIEYNEHPYEMKELPLARLVDELNLTRQEVRGLESGNTQSIAFSTLKKYCEFFKVSADYFVFENGTRTKDTNIKMIAKYTGLDEESLQVINNINTHASPENEQWVKTLNAIIHNPNILYVISEIISSKRISGVLEVSKTPDEEGLNSTNPILDFNDDNEYKLFSYSANGSMLQHTITDELLEAAYWKELESLINSLKEKRKDGDTNAKESTLQSKRNGQRNKAKRSQA